MDNNILEHMPEGEILLDEKMEVEIDIKLLPLNLLSEFEQRCTEKLSLSKEKGFKLAIDSLKAILSDIHVEKERRESL